MPIMSNKLTFERIQNIVQKNKTLDNSWENSCNCFDANFSETLREWYETSSSEDLNPMDEIYLKINAGFKKFENQLVLDLGSGLFPQKVYGIMNDLNAKGYVGLEPNSLHYTVGLSNLNNYIKSLSKKIIPGTIVKEDMKSFLKRIPDNSSSFIASGIDNLIINDSNYFYDCEKLINQKLHPEGIFLTFASDFFIRDYIDHENLNFDRVGHLGEFLFVTKKKGL